MRRASSSYTQRKDVRLYLLNKFNHKCCKCSSTDNLQVDHIVSVYRFALELIPFSRLNDESNLRILCKSCNAAQIP